MNVIEKLATYEDQISPGVSACVGCNVELTLRTCMKVLGPNTIFAVPPGCMGGVGVVGWDKESGAKTPVFFPLLDNVASKPQDAYTRLQLTELIESMVPQYGRV